MALSGPGDFESPASAIPPLRLAGKSLLPVEPDVAVEVRGGAAGDRAEDVPEDVVHVGRAGRQEELDRLDAHAEQRPRDEDVRVVRGGGAAGAVEELPQQERPHREHREVSDDPAHRVKERVRQVAAAPRAQDEALDVVERREIRAHSSAPLHEKRHGEEEARIRGQQQPLNALADADRAHGAQITRTGVDEAPPPPDNASVTTPPPTSPARTTAVPAHEGFFVSEFLGETVRDVARHPVGKISHFAVATSTRAPFPRVTGLLIRDRFETFVLPWEDVAIFQRGAVRTRLVREDLLHRPAREDEIFLARHLLDKQIVDINGVKVVRVNDLKLDVLSGDLVLTAADVGVRGLVRRVFGARVTPRGGRLSDASLPARLIPWDSMQPLHGRLERLETTLPQEKLQRLHPADIAEILSQVSGTERSGIFQKLNVETAAETLHEMEPEIQAEIIEDLPERRASEILEQMPAAEEVTELLVHDENTAGGLMGTDFVTFPPNLSVRETLQRLRPLARDAEALFYFYVVDEKDRVLGALSVRNLLAADDDTLLENAMATPVRSVTADVSADEVAETMSKYDLLALPVTDPEGVLVGIITIDDVVDRLQPQPRPPPPPGGGGAAAP